MESAKVTVRYFAALREQSGMSEEQIQTRARTPGELYLELQESHGFSLDVDQLRVATKQVREKGFDNFYSLAGGIEGIEAD